MINGIKHIIFDLGGVVLNIDYELTKQAFKDLGVDNFDELYAQANQTPVFDLWEMGKISSQEFIETMQKIAPKPIGAGQVIHAWNAMLLNFPLRRMQLLQQLRLHYDLFLLSNTNEIHEEAFNKILMRDCGMANIGVLFDRTYLSHHVGLRKPGKEIFELVLSENGLEPAETLFIDDSIQHVQSARQLGIQAIHLEKGMTIEKDIFRPKNVNIKN